MNGMAGARGMMAGAMEGMASAMRRNGGCYEGDMAGAMR